MNIGDCTWGTSVPKSERKVFNKKLVCKWRYQFTWRVNWATQKTKRQCWLHKQPSQSCPGWTWQLAGRTNQQKTILSIFPLYHFPSSIHHHRRLDSSMSHHFSIKIVSFCSTDNYFREKFIKIVSFCSPYKYFQEKFIKIVSFCSLTNFSKNTSYKLNLFVPRL